jgi:hypothetical protein
MKASLFLVSCVVRYRSRRRADPLSREAIRIVCVTVCERNLKNEAALACAEVDERVKVRVYFQSLFVL